MGSHSYTSGRRIERSLSAMRILLGILFIASLLAVAMFFAANSQLNRELACAELEAFEQFQNGDSDEPIRKAIFEDFVQPALWPALERLAENFVPADATGDGDTTGEALAKTLGLERLWTFQLDQEAARQALRFRGAILYADLAPLASLGVSLRSYLGEPLQLLPASNSIGSAQLPDADSAELPVFRFDVAVAGSSLRQRLDSSRAGSIFAAAACQPIREEGRIGLPLPDVLRRIEVDLSQIVADAAKRLRTREDLADLDYPAAAKAKVAANAWDGSAATTADQLRPRSFDAVQVALWIPLLVIACAVLALWATRRSTLRVTNFFDSLPRTVAGTSWLGLVRVVSGVAIAAGLVPLFTRPLRELAPSLWIAYLVIIVLLAILTERFKERLRTAILRVE